MRVERDHDKMDKVDGQGEIRDKFGARDEEKKEYDTVRNLISATGFWRVIAMRSTAQIQKDRPTHLKKLFNIHTNPSIHPIVVSPRRLSQLKIRANENG